MSIARDISRQTRRFVTNVTSTNAGTNFAVSDGFSSGSLDVYLNGARLVINDDYYLDGTTGIVLNQAAVAGDVIEFAIKTADGSNLLSGGTLSSQLLIIPGSATSPGLAIAGDSNCGLAQIGGTDTVGVVTGGTERFRIGSDGSTQSVIPGGTTLYPEFKCRAWVNFNGIGTVAIRSDGNVTSITDNGVGDYTINFTTAMPDTAYAISGTAGNDNNVNNSNTPNSIRPKVISTTSMRIEVCYASSGPTFSVFDYPLVSVIFFR